VYRKVAFNYRIIGRTTIESMSIKQMREINAMFDA